MALWRYGLWRIQGRDTKLERFCPKHDHIARKKSYLEKWISMDLAKFGPSHGHNSLKNKSFDFEINSHNHILNSSRSFTKDWFQISQ